MINAVSQILQYFLTQCINISSVLREVSRNSRKPFLKLSTASWYDVTDLQYEYINVDVLYYYSIRSRKGVEA